MSSTETIYLLVVILDAVEKLPHLLGAWAAIGMPGVTVLASAGAHRAGGWLSQVGLGSLDHLFDSDGVRRRTLLAAVNDPALLDRAIAEAERVVGGFDLPETGILLVLPVVRAAGLHKLAPRPQLEAAPPPLADTCAAQLASPIEMLPGVLDLRPPVVSPDASLPDVAQAMLAQPRARIACVVGEEGALLGIVDVRSVAEYFLAQTSPEELLGDVYDLDDVMKLADASRMRTARDAMRTADWIERGESVKSAFHKLHEQELAALPVVDDSRRIVGYVDWIALFGAFVRCDGIRGDEVAP